MTENNKSNTKINIPDYVNFDKSGDALDWLIASSYTIHVDRGSLSDGALVQIYLGAIKNRDLKMKIINELKKIPNSELTVEKFEDLFKANVKHDVITYKSELEQLKYKESVNMKEFYCHITNLIAKAMELNPETDRISIEKLAMSEFIKKIPLDLRSAIQTNNYNSGDELADAAEKIRSFNDYTLERRQKQTILTLLHGDKIIRKTIKHKNVKTGHVILVQKSVI